MKAAWLVAVALCLLGGMSARALDANGQLEDGIAKITATLGGEHRSAAE